MHKYDLGEAKMKAKSSKQQKISKINTAQIQQTFVLSWFCSFHFMGRSCFQCTMSDKAMWSAWSGGEEKRLWKPKSLRVVQIAHACNPRKQYLRTGGPFLPLLQPWILSISKRTSSGYVSKRWSSQRVNLLNRRAPSVWNNFSKHCVAYRASCHMPIPFF